MMLFLTNASRPCLWVLRVKQNLIRYVVKMFVSTTDQFLNIERSLSFCEKCAYYLALFLASQSPSVSFTAPLSPVCLAKGEQPRDATGHDPQPSDGQHRNEGFNNRGAVEYEEEAAVPHKRRAAKRASVPASMQKVRYSVKT